MCRPLAKLVPAVLAALWLPACADTEPQLFDRYVAMGGSTAAGWQSGGLVGSTQLQAYPSLLAAQAGVDLVVHRLAAPGCPGPATVPLGTVEQSTCALESGIWGVVGNVATPGARLADAFAAPPRYGLQSLLIGERSQVEAMQRARPTFVSVQFGDHDTLEAALEGQVTDALLTPLADFQRDLDALVAALDDVETLQGVVLIGATDPVVTVPLLQPGAYYFMARDVQGGRYRGIPVNNNCSPVNMLGQPNPLSANLISMRLFEGLPFPEINCDPALAYSLGHYLLDAAEIAVVRARVGQYNAAVAALAESRGWAYLDPNVLVTQQLATHTAAGRYDAIRKCQLLATAATAAQFQAAVLNSCPVTGPTAAPGLFGTLVSFDGVSPTADFHLLLAAALRDSINGRYGPEGP